MFDNTMRDVKERIFHPLAAPFYRVNPIILTIIALIFGLLAAVVLAFGLAIWGFLFWVLNRVFDGLDGTVARRQGIQSDLGGYLDILFDFVVYAAVPIGLALGWPSPTTLLALIALLSIYYVNAASWMYLAAVLEKRNQGARAQDEKTTVTMPAGLIGGTETIVFYTVFILFPSYLTFFFVVMAVLVFFTVVQRLIWAVKHLK